MKWHACSTHISIIYTIARFHNHDVCKKIFSIIQILYIIKFNL